MGEHGDGVDLSSYYHWITGKSRSFGMFCKMLKSSKTLNNITLGAII